MNHKKNNGQSLFEVVFAMTIISLVLLAIVLLSTISVRNNIYSKNKSLATQYGQEGMEWLRHIRDNEDINKGWKYLWNKSRENVDGQTWCFNVLDEDPLIGAGTCINNSTISGTDFVREVNLVKESDPDIITARVVVIWSDAQGQHQSDVITSFTDWRNK